MPKKGRKSIARKRKGCMQGSSSSSLSSLSSSSSSSTPNKLISNRKKHRRVGTSIPTEVRDTLRNFNEKPTENKRVCYRMAIYYHFIKILDAPHEIHWNGKDGTISLIRKALRMHPCQRRVIKRTLQEIMRCATEGIEFNGKIENINKLGAKIIISPGSAEELLIANWMENHCGFRMTTDMVNEHRRQQGDFDVSVYCVMSAFYCLKPKVNVLVKVQSSGHNQGWITARYNQSKQVQAMLGRLSEEEVMTDQTGNVDTQNKSILILCVKSLSIQSVINN